MVKCADCGHLGGRVPWTTSQGNIPLAGSIVEYSQLTRTTGTTRDFPSDPICLAAKREFQSVMPGSMGAALRDEIQEEIDCPAFHGWKPSVPPKEHQEMLDRQQLLDWQAEQNRLRDKRQSAVLWQLAGVAGLFAIVGAATGAVITALLTR